MNPNKETTNPLLQHDELASKYKDEDVNSEKSKESEAKATPMSKEVIIYVTVFFFAMIAHELALEAASTSFPELESLASSVTLFQFGFCFLLPFIVTRGQVCKTFPRSFRATLPYVKLSFLVFGATGLATQSLRYVAYPTKVIFKSAKLIPTMIVSTIFNNGKKYSWLDYFAAFLLCLGAAGYSFSGSGPDGTDNSNSYFGIGLLTVSIVCDAIVPNIQQQLMTSQPQPASVLPRIQGQSEELTPTAGLSAQAVMINTNAVGFLMILVFMLINGSLNVAITTGLVDPRLLVYLVSIGLGLSTAVFAYTKLIKASGSVVAVAVATLRKVATIMLSYIIFPKPILRIHIFSGLLVLIGVLINTCKRRRN